MLALAEEIHQRPVRIFQPTPTTMQSARSTSHTWRLDWDVLQGSGRWENPLMGWASSYVFRRRTARSLLADRRGKLVHRADYSQSQTCEASAGASDSSSRSARDEDQLRDEGGRRGILREAGCVCSRLFVSVSRPDGRLAGWPYYVQDTYHQRFKPKSCEWHVGLWDQQRL